MSEFLDDRSGAMARRLAELESLLDAEGFDLADEGRIVPRALEQEGTLSFGEESLCFLDRLSPGNPAYNLSFAIRLEGVLDLPALASGLSTVAARHEPLRSSYPEQDGAAVRAVTPPGPVPLRIVDLRGGGGEEEALRIAREEAAGPFDLQRGPLLRALLLRLGGQSHLLVLVLHHIVADGWSVGVFQRELASLYAQHRGQAMPAPRPEIGYGDFACWQRQRLSGAMLEERVGHWQERLAGSPPVLDLPADRPRPSLPSYHGGLVTLPLPPRGVAALQDLALRQECSPFMVLLAAFQSLLLRLTGREDVIVGSPVAGRELPELEGLIGFFVNMLVLRTDLSGDPPFVEGVRRVRETVLDALAHQDLPFEVLVEALQPVRDPGYHPLYQVSFTHRQESGPHRLGGLTWSAVELETDTAKWDLMVEVVEAPEGWRTRFRYASDLFNEATVVRLARCFHALLAAAAERPGLRLSDLPLLDELERRQLIAGWNGTAAPYPRNLAVADLFALQVARTPDAPAVTRGGETLTYRELDHRGNRLARQLRRLGVGPEVPVGLLVERSVEAIVAMLAVLKAGGVYVPLDRQLPEERLRWLLDLVRPAVVVAQDHLRPRFQLPGSLPLLLLERDRGSVEAESCEPLASGCGPSHLAYIMFTSGSTGRPKGVCVTHRNLVRLVLGTDYVDLGPGEVCLLFTSLGFDPSTLEIWGSLLNGGRLAVCPPGHLSLEELGQVIETEGVTLLWLTAGLFHQIVDERLESLKGVRQLLAGGDVLSPAHVRRALDGLPGVRLINGYGPTEGTTFTCCHTLAPEEAVAGGVPLGRPIANSRAFVLDPGLQPLPPGLAGELCAAGDGVARGYLSRPDLTAERFVPDPYSGEPGARMYRTGDLVRQRADGIFEFLGRMDGQVKIRGFRIELAEIEAALTRLPGVLQAAVVARVDRPGEKRLVAYLVCDEGAPDPAALRADLRRELPDYMVPAAFVTLKSFPLNPNGKVDRRALPAPEMRQQVLEGRRAPATASEELLAGLWSELLGVEPPSPGDDFFELGGHSLQAMRLVARLRAVLGVELAVRAVFESPGLAALARRVEEALGRGEAPAPLARASGAAVLSFAQERFWFLHQLEGGSAAYNVPVAWHLLGRLEVPALAAGLGEAVRRHQVLRTVLEPAETGPVLRLAEPEVRLPLADLSALPGAAAAAEADRLCAEDAARGFDLSQAPLLRALLLRLAPGEHRLQVNVHHVATDGWSMEVLFQELGALYEAFAAGRPSPLPEPPVQYADFAAWQRERLLGGELEAQLAWWRERLSGLAPVLELPADRPRPAVQGFDGRRESIVLEPELAEGLRRLSRQQGATLFLTLLAAFEALLSRYTGRQDVVVGTPVAYRDRTELQGLVGLLVNTLVLRLDLGGDPAYTELLGRVRRMVLEAFAHQDLPFEKLVESLQPQRALSHTPLVQVMFLLQTPVESGLRLPGLEAVPVELEGRISKFDLTLGVEERGSGVAVFASYRTELFDRATVLRLLDHFRTLVSGAVAAPETRLSDLPLLSLAERQRLLLEWSGAPLAEPPRCLHDLVSAQAARSPEAVALVSGGERLSYAELDRRAGRLASRLRAMGVGPEVRIGVCLDRSAEMVVALLAVLRAGGAYVPLDPSYPRERLAWILEDARAPLVLTRASLAGELGLWHAGVEVVCLDGPEEAETAPRPDSPPAVGPENLAYVIYTSGSTGRPKGVAIEHRSASALVSWAVRVFAPEELAVVFAATSISFDLSVFELFVPLSRGGTVVVAPDALGLAAVPELGVVLANTVPSAMAELVRSGGVPASVRVINLAGEPLRRELVDRLQALPGAPRVLNLYGPSEDTTYSTWVEVPRGETREPSIGRPVDGTRLYLVDGALRLVPLGVPGELCLAGAGLARGYLGSPERTAERFLPDPFAVLPGERLYRTGDLARYRPDGEVEFLGRLDHQVKVRGFRVELGEIESELARHPAVREAVVVAQGSGAERRLAAYVAVAGPPPAPRELRAHLQERLPDYMVPAIWGFLDKLPLTPNGKVDRKALPDLALAAGPAADERPRGPVEEILAEIWAEVLGLARVGVHQGFFELGGHSLLAARVLARAGAALGVDLPLQALFEYPTVAGLAGQVAALRAGGRRAAAPLAALPRGEGEKVPLSFAQQRLWLVDLLEQGAPWYNIVAGLRLRGGLDPAALAGALAAVVARHEVLRTSFPEDGGQPCQRIAPPSRLSLPRVDLAALPEAAAGSALREIFAGEDRWSFDLRSGPLLRVLLAALPGGDHALVLNAHHAVFDGASVGLFYGELLALHDAFRQGEPSPLPGLALQYADFAAWQRRQLSGPFCDEQLAFWRGHLKGAPLVLELPADRPRPKRRSNLGGTVALELPAEVAAGLSTLSRRASATLFTVLAAGFSALLQRATGRQDLLLGFPVSQRGRTELEPLIGFFVNLLPLRAAAPARASFRDLLAGVRAATLAAHEHQHLPFERLVEELLPDRDPGTPPLVQVVFALQPEPLAGVPAGSLEIEALPVATAWAKYDLMLALAEREGTLAGWLNYSTDLFDEATAERMAGHLRTLLAAAAADPATRLADLPLLPAEERLQLLVEWNATASAFPAAATIPELFAVQAAAAPGRPALAFAGEILTYGALDAWSDSLARRLRRAGVGPEVPVGLFAERSPALIAALLGILKAGGFSVPLDPGSPAERLAWMLEDTGAPVLLVQPDLAGRLPRHAAEVLLLDPLPGEQEAEGPLLPLALPLALPDSLAYVSYTSGSTGRPKGVAVPHRAVVRLVRETGFMDLSPEESFLQLAPVSFDASTLEIWGPLLNGGRLVIFPSGTPSLGELARFIESSGVTCLWLTAGLFHQMAEAHLPSLRGVRQLLAGGDVLSRPHVEAVLRGLPGVTLINGYGPTENTTFTCCHPMRRLEDAGRPGGPVPIGRPIANTRVYVLDAELLPVPVGVPGELYAAGAGLARGYFGRADLTAERFIPSPYDEAGQRLYRSGDLARWLPGGGLEFLGRNDDQVKLRGFRVEPGEVAAALLALPGVAEAFVALRDRGGEKRLTAYVVPDGRPPAAEELRHGLAERLPAYMVPADFVLLPALPLGPTGKVDRAALPEPEAAAGGAGRISPRGPVEEMIAALWEEVLGVGEVGASDDFFALGGHSLLATRAISRLRQSFGVDLPLRALFESPTVAGLAGAVQAARCSGEAPRPPLERCVPDTAEPPLSFAQERLWFLDRFEGKGAQYNVPAAFSLSGPLAVAALRAALTAVAARHEPLRTTFPAGEGDPRQRIAPPSEVPLPLVDLGGLPEPAREGEVRRLLREEAVRPFDLERGPVLRASLLRGAPREHVLALCVHHVAADGWALRVLMRDLWALYGGQGPLPELPVRYADYAVWQRRWLESGGLDGLLAYWREHLAGAPPVLDLPADRPRPPLPSNQGGAVRLRLPLQLAEKARELGRREGATLFMVLAAVFDVLLHRVSGRRDLVVGSPVAHRTHVKLEDLVGLFVNTLLLRADLGGAPSFRELLERVREDALGAFDHQDMPFERLVADLAPVRDPSVPPLFQVMFVLQEDAPAGVEAAPGLVAAPVEVGTGSAKLDLTLACGLRGGTLEAVLEYAVDLFDGATARRLGGYFERLLSSVLADPGRLVGELDLLSEPERVQLLREWTDTGTGGERSGLTVPGLFERQAARDPGRPALVWDGREVSYAALAERAGELAARLRAAGVGRETRVAVCLRRTPELVAALLGVMKAGGAYVPLDPSYPRERMAMILEDSAAPVVVTEEGLLERLSGWRGRTVCVDGGELPEATWPGVAEEVSERSLAYVIFTSGSTGRPKGVAIEHGSAVARLSWARQAFSPVELSGVLAATSVCFDLSVFELFAPLSWGGTVILAEDALELPELAARERVRLVNTVPSAASELLRLGGLPGGVRTVCLAGEPLPGSLAADLYGRGIERVWNLYGPSEDTTYSTGGVVPAGERGEPRIGRPLPGTRAYVLDGELAPVPLGVPGELYLSGAGLARGYLGRPELTASSFVPDPFAVLPGGRLYRTGDLARWRGTGELEFLGRIDHQVKVRGFRIELGEVEGALRSCPGVREAVVVARGEGSDRHLVAYLAGEPGTGEAVRAHLRERLPSHAVPSVVVELPDLPRTPNGKVDRRSLPEPSAPAPDASRELARTPLEQALAGIWGEVLGLPEAGRIGVHDDFFALGGHSLKATRVVSRVRAALRCEVPLRAFFEQPTLAGLARIVEGRPALAGPAAGDPIPARPAEGGPQPLSFSQERLWFLDRFEGPTGAFNIPALVQLRGTPDVAALRRALAGVVERHGALRARFSQEAGRPVQRISPEAACPLPVIDLAGLPGEVREATARDLAGGEAWRPFDLERGPLVRATLLRVAGDEHLLLVTTHHIASDGWSQAIFWRELSALYGTAPGAPSPLRPLPLQYTDYARWQREGVDGGRLAGQLAGWRQRLAGVPALELPGDRPRPPVPSLRGGRQAFEISAARLAVLEGLGRGQGATLFMTLLAAFGALLGRLSGQRDFAVGTFAANRTRAEVEGLIGFFVNNLALRLNPAPEAPFSGFLAAVREVTLEAFARQEVPFEKLLQELQPERDLRRTPLFQVMLVHQNNEDASPALPGVQARFLPPEVERSNFDLTLWIAPRGGVPIGELHYSRDLFDAATAGLLLDSYQAVLAGIAAAPDRRIEELPLLTADLRRQVLAGWNPAPRPAPWTGGVHRWILERARQQPDARAVEGSGEVLTYGELARDTLALACRLRKAGVGPESRVGVLLERSPRQITALLAVLEAGGAYVPLDPSYPAERLALLAGGSGLSLVLTHGTREVPADVPVLSLDQKPDEAELSASAFPAWPAGEPAGLAYVIFTSGSTGRPKGVGISHGALANHTASAIEDYRLGPEDRVLQFASISFDAAAEEIFPCLAAGAALVLRDEEMIASPATFLDACGQRGISVLDLPTAYWHELAHGLPSAGAAAVAAAAAALRLVILGGERALPERFAAWHAAAGEAVRLVNTYGPTEATIVATRSELTGEGRSRWVGTAGRELPIGRPIRNLRAYVLSAALEPMPPGIPGELCLGGGGLARGYLEQPAATAAVFLPDPFAGEPGERIYRTGDRVRWLPDGELEFLGRLDQQVKVRGFRIEPGEIEGVLSGHPEVRAAAVVAREDVPGQRRLVAYLAADRALPAAELRQHLAPRLPAYMVPSAFVVLADLPLTPAGKVDRLRLPAPAAEQGPEASATPPRTPAEELLAGIFAEVLGVSGVGTEDGFFDLGGHSLLAMQVVSRVERAFGVGLPLRVLFEKPAVAPLARWLTEARQGGEAPPPLLPAPRPEGGGMPLSFAQQRLWFLDQWQPHTALYNIPAVLRFGGPLNAGRLAASVAALAGRHETLRTTFVETASGPVQVAAPPFQRRELLPCIDLSGLPGELRGREAAALASAWALLPFDLAAGPVARFALLRLAADEHRLAVTLHHAVADAWSLRVLVRDLLALYRAGGDPAALAPLPVQYADYAVWQRGWLAGEALERQLGFWRGRLAGLQPLELPTDRPRPPLQTIRGRRRSIGFAGGLRDGLARQAREVGATLFMALLTGFAALLGRYTGQSRIAAGSTIANRTRPEVEGLIGMFVNTLVLPIDLAGDPTALEALGAVRELTLAAYDHQEVPFEKLVEEVRPERDLSRSTLVQVMFQLLNAPSAAGTLPGLDVAFENVETGTAKFDFLVSLADVAEGLVGWIEYNADLFEASTMDRLAAHLGEIFRGIAEAPSTRISGLPLLSPQERYALLYEWNDTAVPPPSGLLHERFEAWTRRAPEAVAVVCGEESLTYRELSRRANRLAHHLRGLGIGPDVPVGLCLERSAETLVGLMGILKSGGAYVPLDPEHPGERLAALLEAVGAPVLVTRRALADRLPAPRQALVLLDEHAGLLALRPEGDPAPRAAPENLAYVIFTSGSTGLPKGVGVEHRQALCYLEAVQRRLALPDGASYGLVSTFAADLGNTVIFPSLASGGALHVVPRGLASDPDGLAASFRRHPVDCLKIVPSHLEALLGSAARPEDLLPRRLLVLGGDALAWDFVHRIRSLGSCALLNHYGPTETTVGVATWSVREELPLASTVPIGRPLAGSRAYVLDPELRPVPVGVPGELYVAGSSVSRGYLGRPDATAERFLPDPFALAPGTRMYRTGDVVRILSGGALVFMGRVDHQVKIRGFRVEPGEVQALLARQPGVRDALVLAREEAAGELRLVAYLIPGEGAEDRPDPVLLRAALRELLPEPMVPSAFVLLDAFPLGPNGKIDRRRLPAPGEERPSPEGSPSVAPRSQREREIAAVWREALGIQDLSVHDSFFDLGGHSLLLIKVVSDLRRKLGIGLGLVEVFQYPTVRSLADYLSRKDEAPRGPDREARGEQGKERMRQRLQRKSNR